MTHATLSVISPGVSSLVVDAGRARTRGLGVPVGGAADPFSFMLGNLLVGNPPDAAALEISLAGPTLVADASLACAICGAPFDLRTDGRGLSHNSSFTLAPGEVLRIGGTPTGTRAYLCIQGGIDTPLILGSRTGLAPLRAGDGLKVFPGRTGGRGISPAPAGRPQHGEPSHPLLRLLLAGTERGRRSGAEGTEVVRLLPAAQSSWFPEDEMEGKTFRVGPASNRMGMRLVGAPLPVPPREMVSEPVCPGTVQVARDGQCILLGVDGQTIGGYPKIAQAIRADLPILGQLRPGDEVRFACVSLDEAEAAAREQEVILRRWRAALEGCS